jgi:hypothetical protein
MIISIATSFSPDDLGMEQYEIKANELAQKLIKEIPEAQLYDNINLNEINKPEWCYKTYVVLPHFLLARKNNTKQKMLFNYLIQQTRKRANTFILIRPLYSSINYKDNKTDSCISVGFASECYFFEFIKWIKYPKNGRTE